MTDRYEAVAARKYTVNGEERTAFTNIGVAFRMKERDGYSLRLHCLPAPVDGEYSILLFPPKPREDAPPARSSDRHSYAADKSQRRAAPAPIDDDIPFAPEWRG